MVLPYGGAPEEDDDLVNQAAIEALNAQYQTDPGDPVVAAPPPPPPAPVAPAPVVGVDTFAQPAPAPWTPAPTPAPSYGYDAVANYAPPPPAPFQPSSHYVTNEDYFSTPGLSQVGAGWINDPQQQAEWFNAEMNAAVAAGDIEKYKQLESEWNLVKAVYSTQGEGYARQQDPWMTPAYGYSTQTSAMLPDMEGQPYAAGPNLMIRSDVQRAMDEQFGLAMRDYSLGAGVRGQLIEMGQQSPSMLPPLENEMALYRGWDAYQNWAQRQQLIGREQVAPSRFDLQNANQSQNPWERFHGTSDYWDAANPFTQLSAATLQSAQQYLDFVIPKVTTGLEEILDYAGDLPILGRTIGDTPQQVDAQGRPVYTARSGGIGDLIAQVNRIPGAAVGLWSGKTGLTVADYVFVKPGEFFAENAAEMTIQTARFLRNPLTDKSFNQQVQEAEWTRQRFEQEHPWLYLGVSLPFDPWNYVGVNVVTTPFRAAKFKVLQDIPLGKVLSPLELDTMRNLEPSIWDYRTMGRLSGEFQQNLEGLGLNDQLVAGLSKRLAAMMYLDAAQGADKAASLAQQRLLLPEIARRLGASEREIANLTAFTRRDNPAFRRALDDFDAAILTSQGRTTTRTQTTAWADDFDTVRQRGEQIIATADTLPPRPVVRTVWANNKLDPTHSATQPTWARGKVGQRQHEQLNLLEKNGYLTDEEIALWRSGNMEWGQAEDIIKQRSGLPDVYENMVDGYPATWDMTDPAYAAAQQRNAAERVWRTRTSEAFRELFSPQTQRNRARNTFTQRGGVADAVRTGQGLEVMPVAEIISFFRAGLADGWMPPRLQSIAREIADAARHVNADGTLSYVTAKERFGDLLDELYSLVNDPGVDMEDISMLYGMAFDRVFSNTVLDARLKIDAERWLASLGPRREQTLARVEDLKARLGTMEKAERDAALDFIARAEPDWKPPRAQPKRGAEKVAEQDAATDARLAAAGVEPIPPSPPVEAPLTRQVATDAARRDTLAQMERVPVEDAPTPIRPAANAAEARRTRGEPVTQEKLTPQAAADKWVADNAEQAARFERLISRRVDGTPYVNGITSKVHREFRAAGFSDSDLAAAIIRGRDARVAARDREIALRLGDTSKLPGWAQLPEEFMAAEIATYGRDTPELTDEFIGKLIEDHRRDIRKAIDDGKPVPDEILAEYPDLAEHARWVKGFSAFPEAAGGGDIAAGGGSTVVRRGVGDPGFDDPADVMARMAREAVGEAPLTETAMHAIPNDGAARVIGYRGGRDVYAESKYGVIFTAREPQYGASFAAGRSFLDTPGPERGLSALEINAKKVLNLTGLSPAERTARLRAALGDPNADFVQFVDPGMYGAEGIAAYRKQVAALREQGYDLVISPEPMGGSVSGTYAILDPAIARRKAYIHFGDDVQPARLGAFPEAAGGGGDGMAFISGPSLNLPPEVMGALHWAESAGRRTLRARRTVKPIVEPGAFNWSKIDWSAHGGTFDRYMDDVFKYDKIVGKYSAKPSEALALTQQAHVAMTSEVMGMFWRKHIDQMFQGWMKEEGRDPITEMEALLHQLADDTLTLDQVAAIDPFFTSSKKGMEALRTFRHIDPESGKMIGQVLRDNWIQGKYNPYQSVGWLADMGVFPSAAKGGYNGDDLATIFTYLTATKKPRGMDQRAWKMLRSFQDSIGRERIQAVQRSLHPDPTGKWLTGDPVEMAAVANAEKAVELAQATVDEMRVGETIKAAKRQIMQSEQAAIDNAEFMIQAIDAEIKRLQGVPLSGQDITKLKAQKAQAIADKKQMIADRGKRADAAADEASRAYNDAQQRVRDAKRELSDAATRLKATKDIGPESLDALLFPENHLKPVDPYKMAEEMAGDMAALEGRRIGFNPDAIPMGMRTMQAVKGNLVPLWMTIYPGYHLRNITGNVTAQLLAAVRSDMHAGPNPFGVNRKIMRKTDEAGSAVTANPWATTQGIGKFTGSDVDPRNHLLPKLIRGQVQGGGLKQAANYTPLRVLNPLYVGGMALGDLSERTAKTVLWSQEYGWTLADSWRKSVARLVPQSEARDALMGAIGQNDLTTAMAKAGITDPALKSALRAEMNGAIGKADWQAYRTTATALRDYRMRNRMEGILDKVLPVHYWITRNAYFVGSTIANKPGVALAAMAAYDNLVEQNADLPASQRGSLFKVPAEWIPWYDEDYHIRLTSLTNPAFFMAARLANPEKWDLSNTSLPHRLDGYGMLGMRNMWEAMGYRLGPQWDLAIRAGNLANSVANRAGWDAKFIDRFLEGANWVNNPAGYRNSFLPFMSVAQTNRTPFIPSELIPGTGRDMSVQQITEAWNTLVYQSPYTRAETANFMREAADRWQTGEITEVQYWAIAQAVADRQFDYDADYADKIKTGERAELKPDGTKSTDAEIDAALHMVRDIIDSVTGDRAGMWAMSALGAGGTHFSEERLNLERQQRRYGMVSDVAKATKLAFGMDNAAKLVALDLIGLKEASEKQATYESILRSDGEYAALEWMRSEAPWLPGYWAAWDSPEEIAETRAKRDDRLSREEERAAKTDIYDKYAAERVTSARQREENDPTFQKLEQIMRAYDNAMARADGNPAKMLAAEQLKDQQVRELDFPAGSDRVPREGSGYYDWRFSSRGNDPRKKGLMDQEHYPEQLRDLERDAAQRGYLLDEVAEQFGIDPNDKKWLDENGRFDREAYEEAVASVADDAVLAYGELYREMVRQDVGIEPGPLVSRITKDDFIYHVRDKDAWAQDLRDEMYKEKDRIYAMPTSTDEERALRDQAILAYEQTYGDFDTKTYRDDERFTAEENRRYGEGSQLVADWYYTLTPRQKNEFKAKYPEAFTSGSFERTDLHGDQIAEIIAENNLEAKSQGYAEGPERTRTIMEQDIPRQQATERVYQLRDEFYDGSGLTPEQQASLEAIRAHDDEDPEMAERAFRLKEQLGLSWRDFEEYVKQSDLDLAAWVAERRRYTTEASKNGAYDAQEAWFRTLSEYDQQLLLREDPYTFGRFEDATNGSGSGTPAPTTGSGSGTYYGSGGSTYSGGGGSVPGGGGGNRRTGGGAGTDLLGNLYSFDPMLSSGQDDGRGDVVRQIADNLSQQFAAFGVLDDTMRNFIIMGLLNWIRQTLGDNPGMEQWAQVLARLQSPGQQPQRRIRGARPARDYGYAAD